MIHQQVNSGVKRIGSRVYGLEGYDAEIFRRLANHSEAGASYWYKKDLLASLETPTKRLSFFVPCFQTSTNSF
jgi:hypothetical protein